LWTNAFFDDGRNMRLCRNACLAASLTLPSASSLSGRSSASASQPRVRRPSRSTHARRQAHRLTDAGKRATGDVVIRR
jgi:hypothetical protein